MCVPHSLVGGETPRPLAQQENTVTYPQARLRILQPQRSCTALGYMVDSRDVLVAPQKNRPPRERQMRSLCELIFSANNEKGKWTGTIRQDAQRGGQRRAVFCLKGHWEVANGIQAPGLGNIDDGYVAPARALPGRDDQTWFWTPSSRDPDGETTDPLH